MKKLIRTSTIAVSLNFLLKGQLAFFNKFYNVTAVSGGDEDLNLVKEREMVKVFNLKMERKVSPVKDLVSLLKLYMFFKKEKPLIVHSITPKAGLLTMLAGYFAGVPIRLHTFTGLIFPTKTGITRRILITMDRLLCKCATAVYPEGEGVRRDLVSFNITKKPLKIIANGNVNGIDVDYFDPNVFQQEELQSLKADLKINQKDFIFIFVGRLVGDKGINELIAAFTQLLVRVVDVKLLLVGPFESDLDPVSKESWELIESCDHIISVGFQADVRPYFAISDALVFPSYREGFPNVVMQAGSMGLPAIVTDINGCNEIIIDNQNGLIIPVKNVDSLRTAMENLIFNLSLKQRLKSNARKMILERYKQELVWDAMLVEYKSLEQNV